MYEYLFVTCFGCFSSEILLARHCDYSLVSTTYIHTYNKLKVLFCTYEHLRQEYVFMYVYVQFTVHNTTIQERYCRNQCIIQCNTHTSSSNEKEFSGEPGRSPPSSSSSSTMPSRNFFALNYIHKHIHTYIHTYTLDLVGIVVGVQ